MANALALLKRQLGDISSPSVRHAFEVAQEELWLGNRMLTDVITLSRMRPPAGGVTALAGAVAAALERVGLPDGFVVERRIGTEAVRADATQLSEVLARLVNEMVEAKGGKGVLRIVSRSIGETAELTIANAGQEARSPIDQLVSMQPVSDANLSLVILLGNQNAQLFWNGARDATFAFRICFGA